MTNNYTFQDPPLIRFLFADTRSAWLWLVVRLYVGYIWLSSGWGKLFNSAWIGENGGQALGGFVERALLKASEPRPDVQSWYALFLENVVLPHATIWSYLIVWGEILVGLGLIVGLFTGIAAFFGGFMNFNFLLAGTISTNPILLVLSIGLVLAWRVAGYIGLDRFALPWLGTPWQRRPDNKK